MRRVVYRTCCRDIKGGRNREGEEENMMKTRISLAILVALAPMSALAEAPAAPAAQNQANAARAPAAASALPSEGFVFMAEDKGVRVHRREKRSGVEFAVETSLSAPPEQVRKALIDYLNHKRWQKHLVDNKILSRADDSLVVYQRLDLPVVDDRDFTLKVMWGADGAVLWERFKIANELGPKPVEGVVRVTAHEGSWRLEAEGAKGTRAVYRFHFDASGSIPSWLGKGQAQDDIVDFVVRLKRELPKYN